MTKTTSDTMINMSSERHMKDFKCVCKTNNYLLNIINITIKCILLKFNFKLNITVEIFPVECIFSMAS